MLFSVKDEGLCNLRIAAGLKDLFHAVLYIFHMNGIIPYFILKIRRNLK